MIKWQVVVFEIIIKSSKNQQQVDYREYKRDK